MKWQSSVLIRKPAKEVYQFWVNPNNLPHWVQGFERFQSPDGHRRKKGSRAKLIYLDEGVETVVEEEVLAHKPGQLFSCRLSHKQMDTLADHRFLDLGDDTRLLIDMHVKLKPWFYNLFGPFLKGGMKKQLEKDLNRLKNLLEESATEKERQNP